MEKEKQHSRNIWRWVLAFVALILILIASARIAIRSNWFLDIARDMAIEQVNSQINGTLSIEAIRGDLLHGFTVTGVRLKDFDNQDVLLADTIRVNYRIAALIGSPHQVDEVSVSGVDIFLAQGRDSVWNVESLIPEAADTTEEEGGLNWEAEQLVLNDVNINVQSEHLLPDGAVDVEDLQADLTAGAGESGFYGTLRSLDFRVQENRLPETVNVWLAGSGSEERVTLETLVIRTSRTFFETEGEFRSREGLEAEAALTPLSWRDLAAYTEDLPLRQDLRIELGASGPLSDLNLSLNASAAGMENLSISAGLNLEENPVVTRLEITSGRIDAPLLTGDESYPRIKSFSFSGEGSLPAGDIEAAIWSGSLEMADFAFDEYQFDTFSSDYRWEQGSAEFSGNVSLNGQVIELAAAGEQLTGNEPVWSVGFTSAGFNPALWANNPELDGELNIRGEVNGEGLGADHFFASFDIIAEGSRFGEQSFSELRLRGDLDPSRLDGLMSARLERSEFSLDLLADNWQNDPNYQFVAHLREFNVEEIDGLDDFPTYFNGTIRGSGRGTDPENVTLRATARFDSSHINHEPIDTLWADFSIENQFLSVENARFHSPIADADFSLRQHMQEMTNPGNRLDFNAELKDLTALAPLLGFERLEVPGYVNGNIARNADGIPELNGNFEFQEVHVDTLFSSEQISGSIQAFLMDEPEMDLNVEFKEPALNGISVQDVRLYNYSIFADEEIRGNVGFSVSDEENSLFHRGEFRMDSTLVLLQTTSFEFTTALRTLRLSEPFDIVYSDNVLQVDTLNLISPNGGAFLKLWAPHVDSLKQEVGLDARNLNLGALQRAVINEPIFDGMLSGSVHFLSSSDSLEVSATGLLNDIRYNSGEMDTLRFNAELANEWLDMDVQAWHDTENLLQGSARIPFLPGDPLTFEDQFFDRSIEGRFNLHRSDINYWLSFLPDNDFEETEGMISIESTLAGIAGNPELDGNLTVANGRFSGIPVDSVGMDVFYRHDEENISLEGGIVAENRRVLNFNAILPFMVDLRRGEVLLPSEEDSIYANIRTNDFDLAFFSNYVDRDLIRQLDGNLDGRVEISGPLGALNSEGRMELTGGRLRVVPAGITINEIRSRINFRPENIELEQFSMQSGPGRIRASGNIALDNLNPEQLQLTVRGDQFRIANTQDYNAIIDLDASLEGTLENPDLRGSLTFLNGFFYLQNFGERSVEDVRLEEEGEEEESYAFYDSLAMEMDINFDRQFFIRNRQYLDMEIELAGQVDLIKERNSDLEIFGSLEGVEGFARPLGKNFELDNAVVSFFGPPDEPELNIRTLFEPPQRDSEVRIFYIIEGTAQEPTFRFESEPELELQDIISYTLFGRPFYELDSWEQTVAGNGAGGPSAADLAIEVLLDRFEMLASQRLGIDVVQIDNSGSGSNSTTSIKTGWYLNRRTFFAILNEISSTRPQTLFILEYLLRENLELILTQGDDTREGIDLRWHYDY